LPIREAVRIWALEALVAAYRGDTYRLLTGLADLLEASLAYVDRPTVEAHLERPLSEGEWSAVADQFNAMAFDEHAAMPAPSAPTGSRTDFAEPASPAAPHPEPRGLVLPGSRYDDEGQPHLPGLRLQRRLRQRPARRRAPSAALVCEAPARS
jgi:hypothetical protein